MLTDDYLNETSSAVLSCRMFCFEMFWKTKCCNFERRRLRFGKNSEIAEPKRIEAHGSCDPHGIFAWRKVLTESTLILHLNLFLLKNEDFIFENDTVSTLEDDTNNHRF